MSNQLIGIAGVLALTAFLLALRHLFLSIGQSGKNRVRPLVPGGRYELTSKSVADNSWLLWSPGHERESDAGEAAHHAREPQDRSRPPLRFTTGRRE